MSESNALRTKLQAAGAVRFLEGTDEPLFVDETGSSAVRTELPFVERYAIVAIVKHATEDKYLGLKWKTVDWDTLITGGIEEGQTAEEAARAEIQEETGYKNMKLIRTLTPFHSQFYHPPKGENRFGHFTVLVFELLNEERDQVSDKELAKHEPLWLTKEEMVAFRLPSSQRFSWNELQVA